MAPHGFQALLIIILLTVAACQAETPTPVVDLPTRVVIPTDTPTTTPTSPPTQIPSVTPSMTITNTPRQTALPTTALTPYTSPTPTPSVISIPPLAPTAAIRPIAVPDAFVYGRSVEGRDLYARRIGEGTTVIMLVGGIHGGFEANTVTLVEEMVSYFEATPGRVLPGITLILIPSANPDGLTRGRNLSGRFNANGVDLNRNWACGWEPTAFFGEQTISPGPEPFSEPETESLAALINDIRPAIVLFYHSAANGIFAGDCDSSGNSSRMAQILGAATGYNFGSAFTDYAVTGTASAWVDGLGLSAAAVELSSADQTEFDRNLRGVLALQCWLLGESALALPECTET